MEAPGGGLPSTPVSLSPSRTPWDDLFGPRLDVHDRHGYSNITTARATSSVLCGRTSVGVYFSADWCPSCVEFTPLLLEYYNARITDNPPLQIVLVSRCRSSRNTRYFFDPMPWAALPHLESVGTRGQSLMTRFRITTIPALVFLDGKGTVTCLEGCRMVAAVSNATASAPVGILPPQPHPGFRRVGRPTGDPPSRWSTRPRSPTIPPHEHASSHADTDVVVGTAPTAAPATTIPRACQPSAHVPSSDTPGQRPKALTPGFPFAANSRVGTHRPSTPPPPPPADVIPGKGAVSFSLPPHERPKRSRPIRQSSKTSYILTPAQLALLEAAAASAPVEDTVAKGPHHGSPQGEPCSLMQPQPLADAHPFTPTLKEWRRGIAVDCGPDWSWSDIEAAVVRGPHPTARTPAAVALFAEDIAYQVKAGFCSVMSWEDVKHLRPTNLKISPVALVPQVGRRGRIILDLSFPVYQDVDGVVTITQKSVNETTVLTAPTIPVKEIGKVLPRLLQYMRDTPPGLHILFSKLDISDGFWRLTINAQDCFNFAYVLPQPAGEPLRLVIPAAVQMGWIESPGLFCTVTESARDLTQHLVDSAAPLAPDPVEDLIQIPNVPRRARTNTPTQLLQVYVDDFCNAATQSADGSHLATIRRAAIHGIHSLFPPTSVTSHVGGKEPISLKKLAQGDGNFATTKDMIGFRFDGIKRTVHLPATKAKAYVKEVHTVLRRTTVPLKTLQVLVGKLRHASVILPAARGFFTPLNFAMRGNPATIGLGAASEARAALADLISLMKMLSLRPTHVNELVADMPHYAGYHDAAAEGAGGVWFSLRDNMPPSVWRERFPLDIETDIITDDNPSGSITNSDLELAAEVLAIGVILASAPTIMHAPLGTLCDNTPTVSWVEKMASKAATPTAGRLLRGLAFMLHCHHAGPLITVHVPGTDNVMADIASRPTKAQQLFHCPTALTDSAFCSAFDAAFPLPDDQLWTLALSPPWVRFNVFETLRGKRLELPRWTGPNGPSIGQPGRRTAPCTVPIRTYRPLLLTPTSSSRLLLPCGKESTDEELKSRFSQSKKLSGTSPKSSFWTDIQTPEKRRLHSSPSTSPSPAS